MIQEKVHEEVQRFIQKNFTFDDTRTIDGSTSLLGSGIIDSTGILELIGFLETTYGLKFQDNELVGENFDSIDKITDFLSTKVNGRQ
ncbi:MAG TPA: acyl carrier protein [Bacteroidota bacterium]|nr:acyl carrier protein [Bacteroidota bacterium]